MKISRQFSSGNRKIPLQFCIHWYAIRWYFDHANRSCSIDPVCCCRSAFEVQHDRSTSTFSIQCVDYDWLPCAIGCMRMVQANHTLCTAGQMVWFPFAHCIRRIWTIEMYENARAAIIAYRNRHFVCVRTFDFVPFHSPIRTSLSMLQDLDFRLIAPKLEQLVEYAGMQQYVSFRDTWLQTEINRSFHVSKTSVWKFKNDNEQKMLWLFYVILWKIHRFPKGINVHSKLDSPMKCDVNWNLFIIFMMNNVGKCNFKWKFSTNWYLFNFLL